MTARNKKIAAVLLTLLVVGAGVAIFVANDGPKDDEPTPEPTVETQRQTESTPAPSEERAQTVTVRFTDSGFSPGTITVKAGGSIVFMNESSQTTNPSSDPHPTHTINDELNVGDIAPGDSKTITVTRTGQWGMHDHLDPSKKLTVVVQ